MEHDTQDDISGSDKNHMGNCSLQWEFPNSIDRRSYDLIEVGDLEKLESSQEEALCRLLKTVKLKGVGRPRRRKGKSGLGKFLQKSFYSCENFSMTSCLLGNY